MQTLFNSIPEEWQAQRGWTPTTSNDSKRPLVNANKAEKAYTYTELSDDVKASSRVGFITSDLNTVVIIDVDHATTDAHNEEALNLPPVLLDAITKTYTEWSVSGTGLHIVFMADKAKVPQNYIKAAKGTNWEGQVSLRNNFMVTTGHKLVSAPKRLAEFNLDTFMPLISKRSLSTKKIIDEASTEAVSALLTTSWAKIEKALFSIPIDQGVPVRKAWEKITGAEYCHYDFWLNIGMALNEAAQRLNKTPEGLDAYIRWSRQDKVSYKSDADVSAHWASFSSADTPITDRTILAIASVLAFDWPDANKSVPMATWANFQYLMDYYGLEMFYIRGTGAYIKGDHEVIKKYFYVESAKYTLDYYGPLTTQQLQACIMHFCQRHGWRGISFQKAIASSWVALANKLNLVEKWLDTAPEALPYELRQQDKVDKPNIQSTSTFDYLMNCIDFPDYSESELALAKEQIFRTFMQFIKFTDPAHRNEDNGGFLGFIGPEACRKTSFFKWLLPPMLSKLIKPHMSPINGEKGVRDFMRHLSGKAVVLIDEFDAHLDNSHVGSMMKSVITGNDMSMTDIYGTEDSEQERSAIVVGTSNEMKLSMSNNGNRRLWYVEVRYIHMEKIEAHISRYWLYQSLKQEYQRRLALGEKPWLMSEENNLAISNKNLQYDAYSSAELELRALFPFEVPAHKFTAKQLKDLVGNPASTENPHLYSTRQIKRILAIDGSRFKASELERAISHLACAYAGGLRGTVAWETARGSVIKWVNGEVIFSNGSRRLWLLPEYKDE